MIIVGAASAVGVPVMGVIIVEVEAVVAVAACAMELGASTGRRFINLAFFAAGSSLFCRYLSDDLASILIATFWDLKPQLDLQA